METTFADRMRHAMELAGMKAVDLHQKTGISKPSISEYLAGNYEPKQKNLYKIAEALGVKPSYLMGLAPMQSPAPSAAQPPTAPYHPELTERDERDIEKRLQAIRDDLDSESGIALLGDHPLTEDEKEQLLIPIRSGLETARLIAKKKYTPKKYRKDGE